MMVPRRQVDSSGRTGAQERHTVRADQVQRLQPVVDDDRLPPIINTTPNALSMCANVSTMATAPWARQRQLDALKRLSGT
ncbi:MAG: hypothetical protein JWN47_640 [Frankiales bacterium]|nr:hypothetical protein [Frankiales bacterium]